MAEGPQYIYGTSPNYEKFFLSVRRKPKSKLFFITVKDNTQSTKWITIGKVNDWVRRYADEYIITRGKAGGLHFHLICYANKNTNFKSPKGIHMMILQVGKVHREPLQPDELESIDMAKFISRCKHEKIVKRLKIPIQCTLISAMIIDYYRRQNNRVKRVEAKNKYEHEIQKVLDYLQKNLEENPIEERLQYLSWVGK